MKKKMLSSMKALGLMVAFMLSFVFMAATVKAAEPIDWSDWEKYLDYYQQQVVEQHAEINKLGDGHYQLHYSEYPVGQDPVIGLMDRDTKNFTPLVEGTDYKFIEICTIVNGHLQACSFNKNVEGEYYYVIEGMGKYTGRINVKFTLYNPYSFDKIAVDLERRSGQYCTGEEIVVAQFKDSRTVEKKLVEGKDYIIKEVYKNYSDTPLTKWNFKEPGYYNVLIEGKSPYSGVLWLTFTVKDHAYTWNITKKATMDAAGSKIQKCSNCGKSDNSSKTTIPKIGQVALSSTKYAYNGKAPTLKVLDEKGNAIAAANYSLNTKLKAAVGVNSITVTFTNEYSGSKTLSYTITPKGLSVKSLARLSKGFKVTWKKSVAANATGYEIRYSTKSSMASSKKVKVTSYKTSSKKITKLKAKKKYYVQIRAYKKVGTKTYYSSWSAKKAVTTK